MPGSPVRDPDKGKVRSKCDVVNRRFPAPGLVISGSNREAANA
jgi:hypothetical protein